VQVGGQGDGNPVQAPLIHHGGEVAVDLHLVQIDPRACPLDIAHGLAQFLPEFGIGVAHGHDPGIRDPLPTGPVHPSHEAKACNPDPEHGSSSARHQTRQGLFLWRSR